MTPQGDLVQAETYNKLFTLHGVIDDFFLSDPVDSGGPGKFSGALDDRRARSGFPRLNLASWYILFSAACLPSAAVGRRRRRYRLDVLHALQQHLFQHPRMLTALGIFIAGFSSILTGLNFIVTIHTMRAPGHDLVPPAAVRLGALRHQPHYVLGTPVIAITLLLVAFERLLRHGNFRSGAGRRPAAVPASVLVLFPSGGLHYDSAGMGVISEIDHLFLAQARSSATTFIAFSSLAIAVLGFLVWGHHMFVSGQSVYASMIFSFLSMLVAIPSAIKVFNWTATLYKGSVSFDTPMLYALGFIGLFTIGGLTGLFLATLAVDVHVHDTYFVIAHFHYIMVGGAVMGYLGGIHFWWPKMTGRMYPEGWARSPQ